MRDRGSEHRHHRIPNELLHRPPVAHDLFPQTVVVGTEASPNVRGISILRRGCEPAT